ncbi:hypothetical protein MU582_05590 [Nocardioidaceae bacterium SCSIO 66511]|nr:hypothetical protein MU582_05590 [Nocardioidaceae bacterium SCSIO 66511]
MPAPAGADDSAKTVADLVRSLEDDPILVHETMGAGDTAAMKQRLSDLAADLPFDTYVALVNAPQEIEEKTDDPSGQLIQVLHNRLDRPGLYVVQARDGTLEVEAWGVDVDSTSVYLMSAGNTRLVSDRLADLHGDRIRAPSPPLAAEIALRSADDPRSEADPDTYATMSEDEVDELAKLPHAYVSTTEVVTPAPGSRTGFVWMAATAIGVFVLLIGQQTLRSAWPRRRVDPKPAKPTAEPAAAISIDDVRAQAGRELTELAQDLARAPAELPHPEHAQQAMLARDAAEHVHDSDDLADVVGALVLARSGRRDVVRATESQPPGAYRCCYFNPIHGESTAEVGWQFGDARLRVPVCAECARRQKSGGTPDVLVVASGRRERPYYERDDVWARTGFGSIADDLGDLVLESIR